MVFVIAIFPIVSSINPDASWLLLGRRVLHVRADDQFDAGFPEAFDPAQHLVRIADEAGVQNDAGAGQRIAEADAGVQAGAGEAVARPRQRRADQPALLLRKIDDDLGRGFQQLFDPIRGVVEGHEEAAHVHQPAPNHVDGRLQVGPGHW